MSHTCGCRSCTESDAMLRVEQAERLEDFERYMDRRDPTRPRIVPDHETQALIETHWRETIAVPSVRRIG